MHHAARQGFLDYDKIDSMKLKENIPLPDGGDDIPFV